MQRAGYLLESWGGHQFAAGFTIKAENIPVFLEVIEELSVELPAPHIYVDAEIDPRNITPEYIDGLKVLEPFGLGNEIPMFIIPNVEIDSYVPVGWGRSARMVVRAGGLEFPAFCFGTDPTAVELCDGDRGDLLCSLTVDDRRGKRSVSIVVKGLRIPPEEMGRFMGEMALFRSFKNGEELTSDQARILTPKKGDFVGVLRHLRRSCKDGKRLITGIGAFCRRICREEHLAEGYARIMICLEALNDVGKIEYTDDGEVIAIDIKTDDAVDLRGSKTLCRLRRMTGE